MKAHDVRHLRICATCDHLGDSRKMLKIGLHRSLNVGLHHGECVVTALSHAEVLALPETERAKITIGAAGVDLFRKLLDAQPA